MVEPLRMDPVAEAAAAARRYVRDILTAMGELGVIDSAELGVSEMATNATLHSRTSFEIRVTSGAEGQVRIEVTDASPVIPTVKRNGQLATTGRGLRLLEAAGRWGVEPTLHGKTVWFEPAEDMTSAPFADLWAADDLAGLDLA